MMNFILKLLVLLVFISELPSNAASVSNTPTTQNSSLTTKMLQPNVSVPADMWHTKFMIDSSISISGKAAKITSLDIENCQYRAKVYTDYRQEKDYYMYLAPIATEHMYVYGYTDTLTFSIKSNPIFDMAFNSHGTASILRVETAASGPSMINNVNAVIYGDLNQVEHFLNWPAHIIMKIQEKCSK